MKRELSLDYPPMPPPPPEGGWEAPIYKEVENIFATPTGGYNAPIPDDPIDIRRLHIVVGKITYAMKHPLDPDKYVLTYIKMGEKYPRPVDARKLQMNSEEFACVRIRLAEPTERDTHFVLADNVSEIGKFYSIEELENRKVIALCNLEPLRRKNISNTAMIMCASAPVGNGGVKYELLKPPRKSHTGDEILCEEFPLLGELTRSPELPFMHREDNIYQQVMPELSINNKKQLVYKSKHRLFIKGKGFITSDTLANCNVKYEVV